MEILFVSHKYPPAVGGMEKQSFELIQGMQQYARVHTLVHTGQENIVRFFRLLETRILQICREHPGISMIHFNDGLLAAICLRHQSYTHLKRTATLHGLEVVFPNKLYQRFILPRFNQLDCIFAVSRATAAACMARGLAAHKIVVIPNGVDTNIAATPKQVGFTSFFRKNYSIDLANKQVLIAMGRSVRRKGFSWFIQHIVPQLHGDFVFLMIGPFQRKRTGFARWSPLIPAFLRTQIELFLGFPTDEPAIRKLLVQPQYQGKVYHLGKLPFEHIVQVLMHANAFVMPNLRIDGDMEGFGLVCLEASLCGAPVFAAAADGVTEAIQDGQNGFLLPTGDVEAWTHALQKLLDDPAPFSVQGVDFQRHTLEHFSWEKMARKYWLHFQRLASV